MSYNHAGYMDALQPGSRKSYLDRAISKLRGIEFDTIVFSGMSGAIFAPLLADRLGKEIALVRKESDSNHSCMSVEGYADIRKYVFVDDLICSGDTFRRCQEKIQKFAPSAICVASYQYREGYYKEIKSEPVNEDFTDVSEPINSSIEEGARVEPTIGVEWYSEESLKLLRSSYRSYVLPASLESLRR